jgi:hypothetical protein
LLFDAAKRAMVAAASQCALCVDVAAHVNCCTTEARKQLALKPPPKKMNSERKIAFTKSA